MIYLYIISTLTFLTVFIRIFLWERICEWYEDKQYRNYIRFLHNLGKK